MSYLTKHEKTGDTSARGSSAQERNELIANLPEAARLATVCEDAGFVRTVSQGQCCMTGPQLDDLGTRVCREYAHLRDHLAAYPKGSIGVNTLFGPALEVINLPHTCTACTGRERKNFHAERGTEFMGSNQQRH